MPDPNMTVRQFKDWKDSEAFAEYRAERGAVVVDGVVRRTMRVLRGTASGAEEAKLSSYLARATRGPAGELRYGSGPLKVSARTAALRNWGYDSTGYYSD